MIDTSKRSKACRQCMSIKPKSKRGSGTDDARCLTCPHRRKKCLNANTQEHVQRALMNIASTKKEHNWNRIQERNISKNISVKKEIL